MTRHALHIAFIALSFGLAGCGLPSPGTLRGEPIEAPPLVKNQAWGDISPAQLWRAVQDQVIAMEIARRGLHVSDAEIERVIRMKTAEMESLLPGISQYLNHQDDMERALSAWHQAPDESEAIYREMLAPVGISPALWDGMKNAYPDAHAMKEYWRTREPAVVSEKGRENTRNELLRIALAGAIQGTPVVVPEEKWEAVRSDFTEETGQELPADMLMLQLKSDEAARIIGDWIDQMLRTGQLKLSDVYADRIRIWMPGLPISAW